MKNNRISTIVQQVKLNGIVIDVGSDHAQLAIALFKSKKAKHVFNIELNKKPYENTVANLQKANLLSHTTNLLADGLKTKVITQKIDYCVIAGMGGKNIKQIMQSANKQIAVKEWILLPNNNAQILRSFLKHSQHRIIYEQVINDNKYYYPLIKVSKNKGLVIKTKNDIYFGPYNLKHIDDNFISMYQMRKDFIEKNQLQSHNAKIKQEYNLLKANPIWKFLK